MVLPVWIWKHLDRGRLKMISWHCHSCCSCCSPYPDVIRFWEFTTEKVWNMGQGHQEIDISWYFTYFSSHWSILELWKKYVKVTRIHQKNQLLHATAQAHLYKSTKHVTDAKITGCHLCFKDDLPTWMTKSSALITHVGQKTSRRVRKNICSMILLSMTCREPKKNRKMDYNGLKFHNFRFTTPLAMAPGRSRNRIALALALALAACRHVFVAPSSPRWRHVAARGATARQNWMEMLEEAVGTPTPETPDAWRLILWDEKSSRFLLGFHGIGIWLIEMEGTVKTYESINFGEMNTKKTN